MLDDFQIEALELNALQVDHIFLDYFVPVGRVDQLIHYCKKKMDEYIQLGSIAKVECYNDFINMLKCLSIEAEEY